ncbi:hypothetical protein MAPG_06432 [Magnaporthiopsis poae ATCC 64411]|uniref:NACHT domain-containing protein n=1 Tax=Magnaporthiopsis poae (strain ATCC 64411 / 73-15) TaxID=644358 RepID=A0A0C4E206_MAGP6|nr:hypothetical protein MAPG_06432 [Magnaporthiopsis poae ATCC 64411]
MAQDQYPSRPTATDDLVQRLLSGTDPKESAALQALANHMIKVFRDEGRPSHVPEAAALAPVTTVSSYQSLARAFGNAVIKGTADGSIPEPQLLEAFVSVLRCAGGDKEAKPELGRVMKSLQTRLKDAVGQADPGSQYRLLCTLSSVLDALIDTRVSGLSREELHEPLLKQLETLSDDRELRLAQAACYAHQALLGIPNDESPYKALWRTMLPAIEGAAKVAGAVPAMDPAKLFDGLTQLASVPDLISSMVDVVNTLSGFVGSLGGAAEAAKFRQKQKGWYVALRFTDMLLSARAFSSLEHIVRAVPCRSEKEFLCGLYAQLERAWVAENPETKQRIVVIFDHVLAPMGCESHHRRVHEWVKLAADTLGKPEWKTKVPRESRFRWPRRQEYDSSIPCQEPSKDVLSTDLLEKAWECCSEALVFYADVKVREHYLENDERLLKVERLSGDRLPMGQCYINLAVVEQAGRQAGSKPRWSPFSLAARLKVVAPVQDKQVPLHSLFDARKRQDGTTATPQRILIRGQAGVGKTTLCKRIVYNYLHERVWAGMFDRLFWVPLRTLKARLASNPTYNLEQWLRDEYFRTGNGGKFAKALAHTVDDRTQHSRTLFILDGLDEISRELDSETPGLLNDLLKQPYVIITSRPSGLSLPHIGQVDLELETIGFDQDQVKCYVKMAAGEQAAEIEEFLQSHSLIQDLTRIPIQLEALCYSWDASMRSQGAPTTMTGLYRKIESKLWKKDAARLGKSHEGKPLEGDTAKRMFDREIARKVAPERSLLRCIAFTGLCSDMIEFDHTSQDEILDHWGRTSPEGLQATDSLPSCLSLAKISFLRSSDAYSDQTHRSYHFLHLTFQEFFAAQYFVEQWQSRRKLDVPMLGPRSPGAKLAAEAFLRKEKYKARYDVFWRFVAGLLHERNDDEGRLCQFFHTIEDEPRDLLGPTHLRLVMHCLNEVPSDKSTDFAHLRAGLEKRLSRWVLFECSFQRRASLAREMELPEQVLEDVLREGSEDAKVEILRGLRKVSTKAIELIPNWLEGGTPTPMQEAILGIPQPLQGLPAPTIEVIARRLEDTNEEHIPLAAIRALAKQPALPEAVVEVITRRLEDTNEEHIRLAAIRALAKQPALSEAVVGAIARLLEDEDPDLWPYVIKALAGRPSALEAAVKVMTKWLDNENSFVRAAAIRALTSLQHLPEAVVRAITKQVENEDSQVWLAAVGALTRQQAVPEVVFKVLIKHLESENLRGQTEATRILTTAPGLPEAVVEGIIKRLENNSPHARLNALKALANLPHLSEAAVEAVTKQLENEDLRVLSAAGEVLARQQAVPETAFNILIQRLESEDPGVRVATIRTLIYLPGLPEMAARAIIKRLEDEDSQVGTAAAEALVKLPGLRNLSEAAVRVIIKRLQDPNRGVRAAAIDALAILPNPSEAVVQAITKRLEDEYWSVQVTASRTLANMPDLPEAVVEAIAKQLEDKDFDVRSMAAIALVGGRSDFSVNALIQNAEFLYKEWLERSFNQHFSWYIDGEVCVDTPEGFRTVSADHDQVHRLRKAIRAAQEAWGAPGL